MHRRERQAEDGDVRHPGRGASRQAVRGHAYPPSRGGPIAGMSRGRCGCDWPPKHRENRTPVIFMATPESARHAETHAGASRRPRFRSATRRIAKHTLRGRSRRGSGLDRPRSARACERTRTARALAERCELDRPCGRRGDPMPGRMPMRRCRTARQAGGPHLTVRVVSWSPGPRLSSLADCADALRGERRVRKRTTGLGWFVRVRGLRGGVEEMPRESWPLDLVGGRSRERSARGCVVATAGRCRAVPPERPCQRRPTQDPDSGGRAGTQTPGRAQPSRPRSRAVPQRQAAFERGLGHASPGWGRSLAARAGKPPASVASAKPLGVGHCA